MGEGLGCGVRRSPGLPCPERREPESAVACVPRASLVPVFSFGENDLFQQFPNPPGSWVRRAQEALQPLLRVALPLFYGRGGLLLPFRAPVRTVGEPDPLLPARLTSGPGPEPCRGVSQGPQAGGRSWDVPSPCPSRSGRGDSGAAMPATQPRAGGRAARGVRGAPHAALRGAQGVLRGPCRPTPRAHLGAPPPPGPASCPRPLPGGSGIKGGNGPLRSSVCVWDGRSRRGSKPGSRSWVAWTVLEA